jgi:hypothetical protein
VVEASAVCRLPTSRYQWDVEGTATGTTAGSSVRLTLPGGDNAVDVSLAIGSSRNGDTTTFTVNGNLTTRTAAFGDDLRVAIGSSVRGTLTAAPDNRGQVTDGVLNGTIALSAPEDRQNNTLGSCTAADHKWTLVPR